MNVFVIIVNWNGKRYLKECFDALKKQTYRKFGIILVDNGSTDGSVEFIRKNYPKTKIIQLEKNHGFAEANNIGIREAVKKKARYVAILNNDTRADKNWLKEMLGVIEKHDEAGSCACKILDYNDPSIIDTCGSGFFSNCMPFGRGAGQNAEKYRKQEQVFGINGAAALLRVKMLEDVKIFGDYFDSDYFFFQEEFDLSWRALLRGWVCIFVPRAKVYHIGSATVKGKRMSKIVKYHLERNRLWTLAKNAQRRVLLHAFPHILLYEIVSLPYYLFSGYLFPTVKGRMKALFGFGRMWKKRKLIQKRAKLRPGEIISYMENRKYF